MNFTKLTNDVLLELCDNNKVTVVLHFNNGEDKCYFYTPACIRNTRFSTISKRMNETWCQSVSYNGKLDKITITYH